MLGPGFRFHPTDEELVQFYLRRKVSGKGFRFDAIADVDVYKNEPWDLPYLSNLKTRDLEWYFFSFLDKKYGNGARTNRTTGKGYWKTTGKDRAVYHKKQTVGMKKTLVYHCGRAPKGERSNWVMHEYRLVGTDSELDSAGVAQDAFVVCRIFRKSGSGPKNGEQYGAPFVEEEWDDNDLEFPQYDATEEVDFDNICRNSHDSQQILGSDAPSDMAPRFSSQSVDDGHVGEARSFGSSQDNLVSAGACNCEPKMSSDQNIQNSPVSYDTDVTPVKKECIGECSKSRSSDDFSFLLNEPFLNSFDKFFNAYEGFLEANDLSDPSESRTTTFDMLEEYLDARDDSSFFLAFDPDMIFGSDDPVSNHPFLPQMDIGNVTEQATSPMEQLINDNNFNSATSPNKPELTEYQSDSQHPYIKKASQMLGNVQAPPAFAAELPSKDAILRLNSVAQSPSSVHVSASTVHIRKSVMAGKGAKQSPREQEKFNVVLSFGIAPGKTVSATSRCWLYWIFLWILILTIGFKIGTFIGVK